MVNYDISALNTCSRCSKQLKWMRYPCCRNFAN